MKIRNFRRFRFRNATPVAFNQTVWDALAQHLNDVCGLTSIDIIETADLCGLAPQTLEEALHDPVPTYPIYVGITPEQRVAALEIVENYLTARMGLASRGYLEDDIGGPYCAAYVQQTPAELTATAYEADPMTACAAVEWLWSNSSRLEQVLIAMTWWTVGRTGDIYKTAQWLHDAYGVEIGRDALYAMQTRWAYMVALATDMI